MIEIGKNFLLMSFRAFGTAAIFVLFHPNVRLQKHPKEHKGKFLRKKDLNTVGLLLRIVLERSLEEE